jgi:hypothetical protein
VVRCGVMPPATKTFWTWQTICACVLDVLVYIRKWSL